MMSMQKSTLSEESKFSPSNGSLIRFDHISDRLLLHTETPDGSVIPIWEEVRPEDVAVLKDVMTSRKTVGHGIELHYARIPITAERPPNFSDFSELIDVVLSANMTYTPIVVNDQLGRGRSTLTSVSNYLSPYHPLPC